MSELEAKRRNIDGVYRLSPLQEGLLFHSIYAPESGMYLEQFTCVLRGRLDVELFKEAWRRTVARHEAMRALFTWEQREHPLQIVRGRVQLPIEILDWRDPEHARQANLESFLESDRARGFRLDEAPLMRVTLMKLDDDEHRFVWSFHHLLLDGWSQLIVLREVLETYDDLRHGELTERAEPPQYHDYLAWLDRRDHRAAEAFWKRTLANFTNVTELGLVRPRCADPDAVSFGEYRFNLSEETTAALGDMAKRERVTLSTVLRAAWAVVLNRYSGDADVVFGATVSGRSHELERSHEMVGLLINTLPVRARVEPDEAVGALLRRLQSQQIDIGELEHVSLADVIKWSPLPPGIEIFESIVVVQNHPHDELGGASSLEVVEPRYIDRSNFPLAIVAFPGDALELNCVYDRARFEPRGIERVAASLRIVLETLASDNLDRVGDVPVISEGQLRDVLAWGQGSASKIQEESVIELFDAVVERKPSASAVVFEEHEISYRALRQRATSVAHALVGAGVRPDDAVAICLERSPEMVVGILGILIAGGAYVPIDPDWPDERKRFILSDTGAPVVVTTSRRVSSLSTFGPRVVAVDTTEDVAEPWCGPVVRGEQRAYIIYTSGSTGQAKGVEVTHRNLLYSTAARFDYYREPVGRFLLLSPFVFDSSVVGLFWTLTQGGALVLPRKQLEQDVIALADHIASARVSHTLCLPALYALLLDHADDERLAMLRTVIVAGDVCPGSLGEQHVARLPEVGLFNEYGPTEATVWSAVYPVRGSSFGASLPIGGPPPNVNIYLFDKEQRPSPPGAIGEIFVGGEGVAKGYLHRPELTDERFQFVDLPGAGSTRLYRTGDLARWSAPGELDFIGRRDQQVKVHGHRIELEEIDAVLKGHPSVSDAVVVMRNVALAGYVITRDGRAPDVDAIRIYLEGHLPRYMVPASVTHLERLPTTASGKVDRALLPPPDAAEPCADELPQSASERALWAIWNDVLGVEGIGVHSNFFELGGDSLKSVRIIARAKREGMDMTPRQFFENPTIAGVVAVAASNDEEVDPLEQELLELGAESADELLRHIESGEDTGKS